MLIGDWPLLESLVLITAFRSSRFFSISFPLYENNIAKHAFMYILCNTNYVQSIYEHCQRVLLYL